MEGYWNSGKFCQGGFSDRVNVPAKKPYLRGISNFQKPSAPVED
jgi:hypothetical protein